DTIVYDLSATTADVRLRAPESAWTSLGARVISATIDLGAQAPGEALHPIHVSVPDPIARLVRVVRVEPAAISVKLEPIGSAGVPVGVNLIGEPPVGYKVGRLVTQPPTVTVAGPASWVSQVDSASGEFSVQNARAPVSETIALKPVGANGQAVPNVRLEPDRALTTVSIEQLAGFRDVAVKIELTGTIASGYRMVDVNVAPLTVTVFGSPAELESLQGFVETEPIDIGGARASIEKDALLNLPAGVALLGQQSVRVSVKIEPIVGSLTVPSRPITVGLQTGLAARVSPESVEVILVGALPVLDAIDLEKDVRVIIDLSGLGIGTHQLAPKVETPEGIVAQSILPATVQVTIERAPRGAPAPGTTPTPTRKP
ncbi:MAG TPA: CdaR family protein, partial [Anaerolineae bacterium]|nr:CdaR family protein [Anaerolineae bacterium]